MLLAMSTTTNPSDLIDAEWTRVQLHLPPLPPRGRPRSHLLRRILDAPSSLCCTLAALGGIYPRPLAPCTPLTSRLDLNRPSHGLSLARADSRKVVAAPARAVPRRLGVANVALLWWAARIAIGAEHAAITCTLAKYRMACWTGIDDLAGIQRHHFPVLCATVWAS
jgi:hypothetical protein